VVALDVVGAVGPYECPKSNLHTSQVAGACFLRCTAVWLRSRRRCNPCLFVRGIHALLDELRSGSVNTLPSDIGWFDFAAWAHTSSHERTTPERATTGRPGAPISSARPMTGRDAHDPHAAEQPHGSRARVRGDRARHPGPRLARRDCATALPLYLQHRGGRSECLQRQADRPADGADRRPLPVQRRSEPPARHSGPLRDARAAARVGRVRGRSRCLGATSGSST
jgi:hypothetical protein